jgi:hypothetical protein
MIHIHLHTIIGLFAIFMAGIIIPAHLKFKNLTRQKFSGNYMVFHQASRDRKKLIMVFLIGGTILLHRHPLDFPTDFVDVKVRKLFEVVVHISVYFLTMLMGGKIGNYLLKYFEDKK